MKRLFIVLVVLVKIDIGNAQTIADDYILLYDGTKLETTIVDDVEKSGSFIVIQKGRRKKMDAGKISEASVRGVKYISNGGDFFKVIAASGSCDLVEKMTDIRGKIQYNGTDPYVITGTPGKVHDFFLRSSGNGKWLAVKGGENNEEGLEMFKACDASVMILKEKGWSVASLKEAIGVCK